MYYDIKISRPSAGHERGWVLVNFLLDKLRGGGLYCSADSIAKISEQGCWNQGATAPPTFAKISPRFLQNRGFCLRFHFLPL